MKYIGNSKLKKKFNINASSEEVYNNYTNSDSVSVSKKKILGTGGRSWGALAPPPCFGDLFSKGSVQVRLKCNRA